MATEAEVTIRVRGQVVQVSVGGADGGTPKGGLGPLGHPPGPRVAKLLRSANGSTVVFRAEVKVDPTRTDHTFGSPQPGQRAEACFRKDGTTSVKILPLGDEAIEKLTAALELAKSSGTQVETDLIEVPSGFLPVSNSKWIVTTRVPFGVNGKGPEIFETSLLEITEPDVRQRGARRRSKKSPS